MNLLRPIMKSSFSYIVKSGGQVTIGCPPGAHAASCPSNDRESAAAPLVGVRGCRLGYTQRSGLSKRPDEGRRVSPLRVREARVARAVRLHSPVGQHCPLSPLWHAERRQGVANLNVSAPAPGGRTVGAAREIHFCIATYKVGAGPVARRVGCIFERGHS